MPLFKYGVYLSSGLPVNLFSVTQLPKILNRGEVRG